MQRSIPVITAFSLVLLSTAPAAAASVAPPAQTVAAASPRAAGPDESVIVVLKHQYNFANDAAGTRQREVAAGAAQAPVMASLRASHATHVTQLHLIDAVVATVSPAEVKDLAASASVAQVVPNSELHGPTPVRAQPGKAGGSSGLAPGVCPAKGQVQLNPEGVELTHAVSSNPNVGTARKLGFTGAG